MQPQAKPKPTVSSLSIHACVLPSCLCVNIWDSSSKWSIVAVFVLKLDSWHAPMQPSFVSPPNARRNVAWRLIKRRQWSEKIHTSTNMVLRSSWFFQAPIHLVVPRYPRLNRTVLRRWVPLTCILAAAEQGKTQLSFGRALRALWRYVDK